jgi:hypothetical protein
MKNLMLVGLGVFLALSGVTLAQQSGEHKKDSPMQGMMQEMMKGRQSGEGGIDGTGGMGGMMGMMKMMEQCSAMMESTHHSSKETKESPK